MAKGPSAGQSTMIIMFDRFLGSYSAESLSFLATCPAWLYYNETCARRAGISHFNKQAGEAGPFQDEMCDYMPEQHRQLLRDFCAKLVSRRRTRVVCFWIEQTLLIHEKARCD